MLACDVLICDFDQNYVLIIPMWQAMQLVYSGEYFLIRVSIFYCPPLLVCTFPLQEDLLYTETTLMSYSSCFDYSFFVVVVMCILVFLLGFKDWEEL